MAASYRLNVRAAGAKPLRDGLAAVMHERGDPSRVVEVRRVVLRMPGVITATGQPSNFDLVRCTGASNGEPGPAAIKLDSNAANMPSQVVVLRMPDTITGVTAIRGFADVGTANPDGAGTTGIATRLQSRTLKRNQSRLLDTVSAGSDLESMILREGQGLALIQRGSGGGTMRQMRVSLYVRVVGTGRCYTYDINNVCNSFMSGGIFSIMNGSGSGVVLAVSIVEMQTEGNNLTTSRVVLAPIEGIVTSTQIGVTGLSEISPVVSPIAFDTHFPVPTGVVCYSSGFIARRAGTWMLSDWFSNPSLSTLANYQNRSPAYRTRVFPFVVRSAATATPPTPNRNLGGAPCGGSDADGSTLFDAPRKADGIILRPGYGLAVLAGALGSIDNSTYSVYDISIDFIVRHEARGRRAGMTYVS